jgi:hypothetical protein
VTHEQLEYLFVVLLSFSTEVAGHVKAMNGYVSALLNVGERQQCRGGWLVGHDAIPASLPMVVEAPFDRDKSTLRLAQPTPLVFRRVSPRKRFDRVEIRVGFDTCKNVACFTGITRIAYSASAPYISLRKPIHRLSPLVPFASRLNPAR